MALVETELLGNVLLLTMASSGAQEPLTDEICADLLAALEDAAQNEAVLALALLHKGALFSSGRPAETKQVSEQRKRLLELPQWFDKPLVAGAAGPALGEGLGLLLAAQIVVAAVGTQFGATDIRQGLWPELWYAQLQAAVGPRRARYLAMSGRTIGSTEALQWGVVQEVIPAMEVEDRVQQIAVYLSKLPPAALRPQLRQSNC
jgi:enoyl-CoA hydratase/carnithine racemase